MATELEAQFMKHVVTLSMGCWLWTGCQNEQGYGIMCRKEIVSQRAHRWVYAQTRGPVPQGLEVGHLCDHPWCVNPTHLKAMTHTENMSTALYPNRLKTSCPQGHPYDDQNTRHYSGRRGCLTCHRERERKRRAQRQEV